MRVFTHGRVLFPLMFFCGICFLLVDTRVVLKSTQFSSTVRDPDEYIVCMMHCKSK